MYGIVGHLDGRNSNFSPGLTEFLLASKRLGVKFRLFSIVIQHGAWDFGNPCMFLNIEKGKPLMCHTIGHATTSLYLQGFIARPYLL